MLRPIHRLAGAALLAACLGVASPASAQDADAAAEQSRLRAELAKKLEKEFVRHGGWLLDYDAARARAKEEDKLLFVYFSRTYAP